MSMAGLILCRNKYCVLIVAYPRRSEAFYLDSGRHHKKDYEHIKSVMNDALTGYAFHEGPMEVRKEKDGKLVFSHHTNFKSVTQPATSDQDAFYVLMHMREYVRDQQQLQLPSSLRDRCLRNMTEATDEQHREEFCRIQNSIATTIVRDVLPKEGLFYSGNVLPRNAEVEKRSEDQGDYRLFDTLDGHMPFPPRPSRSKNQPAKQ